MLEDEDYVYFFLREQAVEYINCGKVVMMMMVMMMMVMRMRMRMLTIMMMVVMMSVILPG